MNFARNPSKPAAMTPPPSLRLDSQQTFATFPAVKALAFLLLGLLLPAAAAPSGAVIKEEGAVYLEELIPKPVKLAITADAPIYYKIDLGRYLGTLKRGQLVEVQAISDRAYRVRGAARQGQVAGWVEPKFLSPLKKEFIESVHQNAARKSEVDALIAKNEVAINMTPGEVSQALGKPGKKTSRLDAQGRDETWEFIRYERVPQEVTGYDRTGRLVTSILYVKVPAGKLSVTFHNDLVSALEQSEGVLERDARVKLVPAPFLVVY
jgi:hypothetical protein